MGLWHNSKLQADRFAENGYVCLAMDLFNGDPVQLPHNRPKGFNLQKWMAHGSDGNNPHTTIAVDPMVESAIKYVKEELGAKKIACASYCFGAKVIKSQQAFRNMSSLIESSILRVTTRLVSM